MGDYQLTIGEQAPTVELALPVLVITPPIREPLPARPRLEPQVAPVAPAQVAKKGKKQKPKQAPRRKLVRAVTARRAAIVNRQL
jgi:hypothetical protein